MTGRRADRMKLARGDARSGACSLPVRDGGEARVTLRAKLVLFLFVAAGGGACSGNLGDGGSGTGAAGASGGSPAVDAGLPPQDGAAGGAAGYGAGGAAGGPPRLHGIHAFDVTTSIDNRAAPVVAVYNPGGLPPNDRVSAPVPTAQTFTLVLDADSGAVIVGTRVRYATTSDGRTFRVQGSFDIDSTTPAISYGDAVLTAVSDGLSGTAVVTVSSQNGFEQAPSVFRLALSSMIGRPDTTPPSFRWFWEGPMDPMRDFDLFAVEAFPPWADVRFESMEGDVIAMFPYFATTPPPLMGDLSAPFFERTPVVLPYGRTFRLVTSSLTDFAGNHAAPLEFNTLPVPPLIAQDGFESATGVIGAGEIVGAAGVPAITGSKSLYLRGRRPDDGCSSGSVSDWCCG